MFLSKSIIKPLPASNQALFVRQITSGPFGVNNRSPVAIPVQDSLSELTSPSHPNNLPSCASSLCITDPLVVYRDYVSRDLLKQDPQQLRACLEFQKLYFRVKDYSPDNTSIKIKRLVRELEKRFNKAQEDEKGVLYGYTLKWFKDQENDNKRKQLVVVMNDEDELAELKNVPCGLLVNGDVGCGKSMLLDIFANALPTDGKLRIHWNAFILWVMKQIEEVSKRKRQRFDQKNHPLLNYENEFVLFEVASRMIEKFHILMLDEFMLPDIAAAKIIKVLFTYYFKLGGILVATSNRLPEELYTGDFNKTQFGSFEKILRMRCDIYDMNSNIDYRMSAKDDEIAETSHLLIDGANNKDKEWHELVNQFIDLKKCKYGEVSFKSYGRDIIIPKSQGNVAYFDFQDIAEDSKYGPSDFISICSRFDTIILDNIPILSIKMKNHARKLINFIDAIYDARCKVLIKMEVEPKDLFFPDIKDSGPTRFQCTPLEENNPNPFCHNADNLTDTTEDVQNVEMFSKTAIDLSNPYRPNFSSYEDGDNEYTVEKGEEKLDKNFTDMKKFTGEDEMFAYKRAVSRINEMTKSKIWRLDGRWVPNDLSLRSWETAVKNEENNIQRESLINSNPNAPQFKDYNFWSMGKWPNKADKLDDDMAKEWIKGVVGKKP